MDYDDNEYQGQNLQLAGEGCSKVSPVLRPYALPKFDFDDTLQGHLRFDSLVENEVFLGITSQEDNQWIEEYSRGSSGIDFNSSAVESRHNNVWSEATSSESVEMLLKSVGQEERVVEETIIKQSDVCDEPGRLNNIMDPNQDDEKELVNNDQNASLQNEFLGNFTSQSQDSQISGGELDKIVINEKLNSSVSEEKVDNTSDYVIQKKSGNLANESMNKELQENPSVSTVEFRNPGSLEKIDTSIEDNIKCQENSTDVPIEVEKPLNIILNVESVENPSVETSISSVTSGNAENFERQAVQDGNTKLENPNSPELNADSLFDVQNSSVQETKYALVKDAQVVTTAVSMAATGGASSFYQVDTNLTAGKVSHEDVIAGKDAPEIRSSEQGAVCIDQDVSFNETGDAGLPRESADVEIIEVCGDLDSQKNVESSSYDNTAVAHNFEFDMSVRVEPVAFTEPDNIPSPETSEGAHLADTVADDQPKSPIFGVSLVHQDNTEKAEIGLPCEENSQDETPQVESVVYSSSKEPSSLVEKGAIVDLAKTIVHGIAVHCAKSVESCNVEANTGGQECSKTLETSPCKSSGKKGENSEAGGLLEPKELMTEVNKSNEHRASVDVTRSSESDTNHIGQDGGSISSLEKPQSICSSRISNIISTELSQSAKDKQEVTKGVTLDNARPSKVIDESEGNVQPVSSSSVTQEEKSFTFEVGKSARLGQAGKGVQSYPTFQPNLPTITEGPSINSKKLHEASLASPQIPSGVKGKSERKTRRKSVGKESAQKVNQPKESTPARDSGRVENSSLLLTPPAIGQVVQFEEAKPNENVEHSGTKPGAVRSIPSPKLPDLNNSTTIFQQPFTDNQQVQLRAQILVYGSLISGAPPEEPHMIAAFGQSDGGRTWDGVWRACLERLHVVKAQANPDTPMQSRSDLRDAGNRADQGTKHTSVQNKIPGTPPIINPMIPHSSPIWNISTPGDNLQSSGIPRTARLDYHQPISPLHSYQTPAMQNFTGHNPSWLSQAPFSGQWLSSSPIPAYNIGPRFSPMPITEAVKLTSIKESSLPVTHSAGTTIFPASGQLSGESKSRKRKKGTTSVNVKSISDPSLAQISPIPASVVIHTPPTPHSDVHGKIKISLLTPNQTDSVTDPVVTAPFSSCGQRTGDQKTEKLVISEETLSKVEESKLQAEDAAKLAAAAVAHCHGVWSQLGGKSNSGLSSDDEAKLVSSAISIAAAASVAKVAAAAAKIASNVAEQARSMVEVFLSNKSGSFDQSGKFDKAETVDAIVKAAELAAEAVAQAGKIVAMGDPLPLSDLVEAGPEGYWKTPRLAAVVSGNLNISSDKKNIEAGHNVSGKEIPATKCGLSGKQNSVDLAENWKMDVDSMSVPIATREKDIRKFRARKGLDSSKAVGVTGELETGSIHMPKVTLDTLKENNIKEGCLVEVYKDDDKNKGAWFGANVLSLKDKKALVSYTEIQSDEGQLKEWVPLEVEGTEVPKIRVAHPMTSMRFEGTRKRRRTAVTDFMWSSGDRVDVWIQDRWREGIVVETNKIDVTSLTIRFPAHGETSVVRSWHVRPTLAWKDGKWIECHTSKERVSSQGDTPQEKRLKLGSSIVESKPIEGSSENVDLVDPKKHEEPRTLPLSTQESLFNMGSTRDNTRKPIRTGLQKDGPRVIFGVPKPGKKQKFMDVSTHYNKNDKPHDSVKFTKYLIPQPPGSRGWKTNSRNDAAKEKQAADTKPRAVKPRKPPIPASRTSRDAAITNKTVRDSGGDDENQSDRQNRIELGSSSNNEDSTGSTKSERLKKRKFAPAKVENPRPEHVEPRRSNRKIQPTSRLLEGLQSSMTISKIPSASHSSQRSHSKVTPKGNSNNG